MIALDLAGSEKRDTGYAYFENEEIITGTVKQDDEILEICKNHDIIAIDAPLTLPKGRKTIEERGPHYRECDLVLKKMNIRFFPISLGPMRMLTKRGISLAKKLKGKKVIEIYPGGSLDILGLKRKNIDVVRRFLNWKCAPKTIDESDAAIGLFTLWQHQQGFGIWADGKDGRILLSSPTIKITPTYAEAYGRKSRFKIKTSLGDKYLHDTGRLTGLLEGKALIENNKIVAINNIVLDSCIDEKIVEMWLKIWGFKKIKKQQKINDCRFDFESEGRYIEVKGVSYIKNQTGYFPDCFSTRAVKHFKQLRREDTVVFVARKKVKNIRINPEFPEIKKVFKSRMKKIYLEIKNNYILSKELK